MKILIILIISSIVNFSYAWTIDSQVNFATGKYTENISLYCTIGETLCMETCGNANVCVRKQALCYNCLGVGQPLLRILFTEVERLYQRSSQILSPQQVNKVFQSSHLFIGAKSIFNFYTPVDAAEIQNRFHALCPETSSDAVFVLTLKNDQPAEIKYLICKNKEYESEAYVVEYSKPKVQLP